MDIHKYDTIIEGAESSTMRIDFDKYLRVINCAESKYNYILFINLRAKLYAKMKSGMTKELSEKLDSAKTIKDICSLQNHTSYFTYEDIIDILHGSRYRIINLDINCLSQYVFIEYVRDNYIQVLRDMRDVDMTPNKYIKYVKDVAIGYGISSPIYYIYVYEN